MKTRIISALVALPLLIFIVVSGGNWLHAGIGILGLIGMREFYRAFSKETKGAYEIAIRVICSASLFLLFCLLC